MSNSNESRNGWIGLTASAIFAVTTFAIVIAIHAFERRDWTGAGISVLAANVGLGMLLNAISRR